MPFFFKVRSVAEDKANTTRKRKLVKMDVVGDLPNDNDEEVSNKPLASDDSNSSSEEESGHEKRLKEVFNKKKTETLCNYDEPSLNLRQEYLKSQGKRYFSIAHNYAGADVENIQVLKSRESKQSVTAVCIFDRYIYSGNKNGTIIKYMIDNGTKIVTLPYITKGSFIKKQMDGHYTVILSLTVPFDGKFLAVGDQTKEIQIRNPETLKHIKTLSGHKNIVTGLAFKRDSHQLYSCSKDRTVKVWTLDEMTLMETLYGHTDEIMSIDSLFKDCVITAGGQDKTIRFWKMSTESHSIHNGVSWSIDVVKMINEEQFVSGGTDGSLSLWSIYKKKPLCLISEAHGCDPIGNPYWITSIASVYYTDLLASGSENGCIKIWKIVDKYYSISLLFNIPVDGFINDLCFKPDGKYLFAAVGRDHRFGRWTVSKMATNAALKIPLLAYEKNAS